MKTFLILVFILVGISGLGYSQTVFKCIDEAGTTVFSDSPCAADAEEIYVEDTQSGISTNQSYNMPISERMERNRNNPRDVSRELARTQNKAKREFDRRIKEGWSPSNAQRAADVVLGGTSARNYAGDKQILSSGGGFYRSTGNKDNQYWSPSGGLCDKRGTWMYCGGDAHLVVE